MRMWAITHSLCKQNIFIGPLTLNDCQKCGFHKMCSMKHKKWTPKYISRPLGHALRAMDELVQHVPRTLFHGPPKVRCAEMMLLLDRRHIQQVLWPIEKPAEHVPEAVEHASWAVDHVLMCLKACFLTDRTRFLSQRILFCGAWHTPLRIKWQVFWTIRT